MFEVGKLIARISMEGADTFRSDLRSVGSEFKNLSSEGRQAADEVGAGLTLVGGGILALAGLAVTKFAEFDSSMSQVKAASGESGAELENLRQTALAMGADTKYSATEAADGIVQLAKAGVDADDVIGGGLAGSLALAAAGEISVADAAETAATAMTQFKLSGDQIPHLADLLAAGAGKAQGGVDELSMALKQGGLVAAQMGLSVDDTVGTLTAFASAGLLGSDAGTSFKTMLLSLANPSSEAASLMKELGIDAYDAQGQFVGMESIAGQLQSRLGGLTQEQRDSALATIFGSDAIRAASVLYAEGADGVAEWTEKVNDSGFAARQAAELQNNLAGDVEKLGGAFDTALIQSGSAANDVLRDMIQGLTGLIDGFGELPEPVQQAAFFAVAFTGALALAAGALLLVIPRLVAFRSAVQILSTQMPVATGRVRSFLAVLGGPWGVALAAAGAGLAVLNAQIEAGVPSQAKLANALEHSASSADLLKTAASRGDAEQAIWGDYADSIADLPALLDKAAASTVDWLDLSFNEQGAVDSINRIGQSLADVAQTDLPAAQEQFAKLAEQQGLNADQQLELLERMGPYKAALEELAQAQGINFTSGTELENNLVLLGIANGETAVATEANAETQQTAAEKYLEAQDASQQLVDSLRELIDATNEANGVGQDAVSTNAAYQQTIADVAATIEQAKAGAEGYSTSIDESTAAGSANADMFRGLAADSQAAAAAQYDLDVKTMSAKDATDKYVGALQVGRQNLYDNILALTGNADAAQVLTDKVYGIPTSREIDILANTADAIWSVEDLIAQINGRVATIQVRATMPDLNGAEVSGSGRMGTYANGGIVRYYAGGGFENHVAQIARAGTTRVWAEPETEGEVYIPLAASKRGRSEQILAEAAQLFGFDLTRRGESGSSTRAGASSGSFGGLRIAGTLDLGGGLSGYIDGKIIEAFDEQDDEAKAGTR